MRTSAGACAYLKDLEAGDVEHTDVVLTLGLGVQCLVDALHEPRERLGVEALRQSVHGEHHLIQVLALGHVLAADLDLGCEEGLEHVLAVDAQQEGSLLSL